VGFGQGFLLASIGAFTASDMVLDAKRNLGKRKPFQNPQFSRYEITIESSVSSEFQHWNYYF
jgi:hypothetical protein